MTYYRFRNIPFVIGVIGFAVSLQAQSSRAGQQEPIFRTRTEHVSLDVVVTDQNDRPITDLTAADFRITDANRPQTVADFRLVSVPSTHHRVNLGDATPAPPDVATNGQSPGASRAFAFVFDMSLSPTDIVPWKREMTNFLENMAPDDQMAIAYVGRSDLGQDFTSDPGRLVRAINNLPAAMFAGQIPCGAHPAQCTLLVLDNAVKTLAAAHQSRRFIVLASAWGCIPGGRNFYAQACHDLIESAKRADVPIYGIGPPGPFQAPGSLQVLARETGARAFVADTPTFTATREILADNGTYYLLGFYPDPLVADGKFHRVKVTVSRPGAHVRARQGYEAPPASENAATPIRAMNQSLAAGLDDPTLPLRATVTPLTATAHGIKALVTVELAYPSPPDQALVDDDLQLGILAIDPDGHVRGEHQQPFRISGIASASEDTTIVVDDVIDLPSEQLVVRVGVSSRALGRTGTIHIPLTVPNPADTDLQLSGIVFGLPNAKPLPVLGMDRFAGLVPFQPTTARTFGTTDTLRVFARAFWRGKERALTATVAILGDVRAPMAMTVPATDVESSRHEAEIDTTIPLTGLTLGPHTLLLNVRLANGANARHEIPFEIR